MDVGLLDVTKEEAFDDLEVNSSRHLWVRSLSTLDLRW